MSTGLSTLNFKIVLHAPEIPGNTGSLGRTCLALNAELILIKPYGFEIDEKAVRRAGLDYWKYVTLREFESWDDFIEREKPKNQELIFFENGEKKLWHEAPYTKGCYLIFGGETLGLPTKIRNDFKNNFYAFPQYSEHIRSINLSNVATAAAYECLRQII